jgi:hypothetical protein
MGDNSIPLLDAQIPATVIYRRQSKRFLLFEIAGHNAAKDQLRKSEVAG